MRPARASWLLLATVAGAQAPFDMDALRLAGSEGRQAAGRAALLARAADRAGSAADHAAEKSRALAGLVRDQERAVVRARFRLGAARAAERTQADRVAAARAPLVGLTAALARLAARPPLLALASGATLADIAHLRLLIGGLRARIDDQNRALDVELARRERSRSAAARELAALADADRLLAGRRVALARARADLIARRTMLADAAEREGQRAAGLAERERAFGAALAVTVDDRILSARLAALPGPMLRPDAPAERRRRGTVRALYSLPAIGRIVRGTGEHDSDGVRARGVTIATSPGTLAVAPGAGRVRYAGPFRNYGDIVILDHGHGWTSLVAGLDRAFPDLGDDLAAGAGIGRAGRRLLVELRHDGRPVDIVAMVQAVGR